MKLKLKLILAGLGALVAAIFAMFRGGSKWKDRAEKATEAANQAHHEVIDAKADKALGEVEHDLEDDLDRIDDMSHDDLFDHAKSRTERG